VPPAPPGRGLGPAAAVYSHPVAPLVEEVGTYPTGMQALPFPAAAAQAAADQCRAVATLVDEKMSAASTAAATTASWSGVYAVDFGIAWPDTEMSATELSGRLRTLAGQLEDAIAEAAAENERRAGLRADWDCRQAGPNRPC